MNSPAQNFKSLTIWLSIFIVGTIYFFVWITSTIPATIIHSYEYEIDTIHTKTKLIPIIKYSNNDTIYEYLIVRKKN